MVFKSSEYNFIAIESLLYLTVKNRNGLTYKRTFPLENDYGVRMNRNIKCYLLHIRVNGFNSIFHFYDKMVSSVGENWKKYMLVPNTNERRWVKPSSNVWPIPQSKIDNKSLLEYCEWK